MIWYISIERYFQGAKESENSFPETKFHLNTWALEVVGLMFGKKWTYGVSKITDSYDDFTKKKKQVFFFFQTEFFFSGLTIILSRSKNFFRNFFLRLIVLFHELVFFSQS